MADHNNPLIIEAAFSSKKVTDCTYCDLRDWEQGVIGPVRYLDLEMTMKLARILLPFVLLLLPMVPGSAWAWSRDFRLINHTGYTITRLYLSSRGYSKWVRSNIPIISPNNWANIHFYNGGPCWMQFRIETREGNTANFMRPFNFCALRTLTIYYNNENGVFTADAQ
jgi:hypothetical protein